MSLNAWLSRQDACPGIVQVKMGFPQQNAEGPAAIAFIGSECIAKAGGYICPRCANLDLHANIQPGNYPRGGTDKFDWHYRTDS